MTRAAPILIDSAVAEGSDPARHEEPVTTQFVEFVQSVADDLADEQHLREAGRIDTLALATVGTRGIQPQLAAALEFECMLRGIDWADLLAEATRKGLWPDTSN